MSGDAIAALSMSAMNFAPAAQTAAMQSTAIQSTSQAKVVDVAQFQAEFDRAQQVDIQSAKTQEAQSARAPKTPSEGMQWLSEGLNSLSNRAQGLAVEANKKMETGQELKPKDMLMLTVHAHEFLFHCELTSNVANRTSDGITQLFRQQS